MIIRLLVGGGLVEGVRSLRYTHAEFQHEIVQCEIPRTRANVRRYSSGTPVQITWGLSIAMKHTFVGYVSNVDPQFSSQDMTNGNERSLTLVCIGASYMLKDGGFLTMKSVSASTVARRLGESTRFDTTNVQAHPYLAPLWAQAGRSAFSFLNDLAHESGYTHYVRGLSLYFHDRLRALSTLGAAPLFTPRSQGGWLLDFDGSLGTTTGSGGDLLRRTAHGVNPRTGKEFAAVNNGGTRRPLLGRERMTPMFSGGATLVADDYGDAASRLSAIEGTNELALQAKIRTRGSMRVYVGGAVQIQGLDSANDGLWFVSSVEHYLTAKQEFVTKATIGRDALGGVVLPPQPARTISRGARLVNSKWVLA